MARADHIKVKRFCYGIWYWHHGIDLGDGTVVHFTGEPMRKKNARIRRTSMFLFLRKGKKIVCKYSHCYKPDRIVRTALKCIEKSGYRLFSGNCEHFARYCKTREKKRTGKGCLGND